MKRASVMSFFVALAVIAIISFAERARMEDAYRTATAPKLPAEVAYEDIDNKVPEEPKGSKEPEDAEVIVSTKDNTTASDPSVPSDPPLPPSFNLAVPFTSQAPFANWDEVHEETCEEASLYMVHAFYQGMSGPIDPQTAEDELQRLVAKEMSLFGYYKDTTASEMAALATAAYGVARVDLVSDPTVEQMKELVASGHPIIVPAAGRELGNPYFTPPGPVYHAFVIRGYADAGFIVNDPGTRHGAAYVYPYETVMDAMHDWNSEQIDLGRKVVLVLYP